jgi:hypothetical protein
MELEDHVYYLHPLMQFLILIVLMSFSTPPINNSIITGRIKEVVLQGQHTMLMDAIV